MKTVLRTAALLVLSLCLASHPGAEPAKRYVCPPCGLPCDSTVFDKPGTCPRCGMTLVDQETLAHDRALAAGEVQRPLR